MKKTQLLIGFVIVIACSYISLWFGFVKGYQYELGQNLAESVTTSKVLALIREGKDEEAIGLLESMLDTKIVERSVSDKKFVKYIIGMSASDVEVEQKLEGLIIQYRNSTNYSCAEPKPVCDIINGFLNGSEQALNNQYNTDSGADAPSPVR